jgi:hypothetical protein
VGVGADDDDDDLAEGLKNASEALEDDVGLAEPLAADVLERDDGEIQGGGGDIRLAMRRAGFITSGCSSPNACSQGGL